MRLVDEVVDVPDSALLDARVAAALIRDAGAPDLGRVERRDERQAVAELEAIGVGRGHGPSLGREHLSTEERHRVLDTGELPEVALVVHLDSDRDSPGAVHPADDAAHQ